MIIPMKYLTKKNILIGLMALLTFAMLASGVSKLAGVEDLVKNFRKWGYPDVLLQVVGVSEIILAILIWWKPVRIVALLGLILIMGGAIMTHSMHYEWSENVPPIVLIIIPSLVIMLDNEMRFMGIAERKV